MDWDDSQVEDFQERYKKLVRVPLAHKDLKSPMGYWASEDPATSSLWRQHFATRKPKEPRNKKGNELAKNVYDIQAEDYLELTPGENTIVYDELDGSIAGVVLWDFLKDGCIEGSLGHGLIEYIDKTICSQGKMLRDSRVSQFRFLLRRNTTPVDLPFFLYCLGFSLCENSPKEIEHN